MAITLVDVAQVPKRQRRSVPRIMRTVEWTEALKMMAEGLPPGRAIVISLTPEEMSRYRLGSIKAAARPIKRHVKTYGLPYTVTAKNTVNGAAIVIASKKTP
ncbi:MAG: hypothetical protein WCC22_02230 [Terriglobales bacterium]